MNLFFDLDGTLTDPRVGIVRCIRHALEAMGAESPPDTELEQYIGPSLFKSFRVLLGTDDPAAIARAVTLYRERFTDTGLYENRLHEGIETVLSQFRDAGDTMLVVTTKPTVFARRIVEHFRLDGYFADIVGAFLDGTRSEKSELIGHALAAHAMAPAESIMIGDRCDDVAGALARGVAPVGVLWGFGDRAELEAAGAREICERPGELPDAILRACDVSA